MVQAQAEGQNQESDVAMSDQLTWTANLVSSIEKKLRAAVSADELKKLSIDSAKPEFRKVIQQFICPICTNVLEDFTSCAGCEGLLCRSCLNQWLSRESSCPLCKEDFEEFKVSRQVRNVLNMCEFTCPYGCDGSFTYENRKRHFDTCSECTEQQKCPFCTQNISQMQQGLTYHVRNDCEGSELMCDSCNLNVYYLFHDLELLQKNEGHDCAKDMRRLVGLHKRLRQLEKFSFPFELDRQALKVIEMHGFSPEEISMFKDKAVQYFRTGPDLYQFANMIMKFCSDLGHGEHWFVTVRPKNIDQGGWLHRDANFRLKMEFKRAQEEYSFNIFKLL